MKTHVREIEIKGDYGPAFIRMRMPNGDLKRRFLQHLLQDGVVIPSEEINKILLEVLKELNDAYHTIRFLNNLNEGLEEEIEQFVEDIDAISEKHIGEVEGLESHVEDLKEEISDLQADMAMMNRDKEDLEAIVPYALVDKPRPVD